MIQLEHIRELNEKVQSTLEVIRLLREENSLLRGKLEENEARVKELEVLVSSFRNDQDEIEEGIKGILLQLDRLEEEFTAPPSLRSEAAEAAENTSSVEEEVQAPVRDASSFSPADEAVSSPVETSDGTDEEKKPGEPSPGLPSPPPPSPTHSDSPSAIPDSGETELDIF